MSHMGLFELRGKTWKACKDATEFDLLVRVQTPEKAWECSRAVRTVKGFRLWGRMRITTTDVQSCLCIGLHVVLHVVLHWGQTPSYTTVLYSVLP